MGMGKGRLQRKEELGYKSMKIGNDDDISVGGRPEEKICPHWRRMGKG